MSQIRTAAMLLLTVVVWLSETATPVLSKTVVLEFKREDVAPYNVVESDIGRVFVLSFDVPPDVFGKRLDSVLLEFYVDASLKPGAEPGTIPMIDVLKLMQPYAGEGIPDVSMSSARRNVVPLGEGHRVVADVTDVVKEWMSNPTRNHGLIVGSLTGSRDSAFTIRSNKMGNGRVVRATFFYQNRFGNRVIR